MSCCAQRNQGWIDLDNLITQQSSLANPACSDHLQATSDQVDRLQRLLRDLLANPLAHRNSVTVVHTGPPPVEPPQLDGPTLVAVPTRFGFTAVR